MPALYLCCMLLPSLIHHGILRYVEVNGDTPLEALKLCVGFDQEALSDLVLYEQLERSEEDVISVPGQLSDVDLVAMFKAFCKAYPGTKRGTDKGALTELSDMRKKHKNWRKVVPELMPNLERQIYEREIKQMAIESYERAGNRTHGLYMAPWKNLRTYLHQACWNEVYYALVSPAKKTVVVEAPASELYEQYRNKFMSLVDLREISLADEVYIFTPDQLSEWKDATGDFEGRGKLFSTEWAIKFFWQCHRDFYFQRSTVRYRNIYAYTISRYKEAAANKA